ncbi:hypothetical protein NA56DRAFT_752922 [Hyaloscypha hepaticicola]|uniref:TPR-like protein n=1 Tax=Hyaloscypha hepaticicola TaxID=2082293 RepID=A0A2J6PRI7_9HELO|nr:hypothetical protein NA56DRAFT_752922 [Hyaloscypha hepaticicola]
MDPLTITTAVKLKITATCLSAAQSLNELRNKYNDAPMTIVTICSEATLISASLSQIQNLVLRRHDLTNVLQARPDLAAALDTSLIGCAVLFSCLHEEVQCITKGSMLPDKFTWKGKARAIWNHDRLRELLDGLRGQQTAINTNINLLQVNSLEEIKELLQRHNDVFATTAERTRSLRESTPTMNVPNSIYGGGGRERSIYPSAISVAGSSGIEFDFDDQIVNSKVYKRMLAQAMTKTMASDVEAIEGDVIDSSGVATIKETAIQKEEASAAARLLEGLVISQGPEKVLSKEHIDTFDSKFWLAKALHSQQKYTEAEEFFRESVLGQEKVLGKEHIDTLRSKVWLATTLHSQQKYTEAEEFFRESVLGQEKVLGKEHIDTLRSKVWLATTLHSQQKYTEAEEFFRESVLGREKVLADIISEVTYYF